MADIFEAIGEFIGFLFLIIFATAFILAGLLLKPLYFLVDGRRYVVKKTIWNKRVFWWVFCWATHFSLKEEATCSCCGIPKKQLIKVDR